MGKQFTLKQDMWIRAHNDPNKTIRQLTAEYNEYWDETRSVDTMKHHCRKMGLQRSYNQPFTSTENAWLIANSKTMSYKETAERFNELFSANRSPEVIKVHCNRELGIRFKGDRRTNNCEPVGTEKIYGKYVYVKVSDIPCDNNGSVSFNVNWKPKTHLVWEQHYGSMPPNEYTIIFLDGNPQNCDINNLYAVDGKVLREMSKKSWWKEDPDLTLAAIKWCELFYAMKKLRKGD